MSQDIYLETIIIFSPEVYHQMRHPQSMCLQGACIDTLGTEKFYIYVKMQTIQYDKICKIVRHTTN